MTKRRIILCLTAILLLCSLTLTAFAAGEGTSAKLDYVTDPLGYLTDSQREQLGRRASEISAQYGVGVYILVVDDYHKYASYPEIYDCLISIYDQYELGWGADHAGMSLMLSMDERDYALDFNSERAQYAVTERGHSRMEDRILQYFRQNDWYGGFSEYLDCCEEYLEAAKNGNPVGSGETKKGGVSPILAIPGLIVSLLTGAAVKAPMKSSGIKREANDYLVPGSLQMQHQSDVFLHRTVTRTNKSSSSGSSHHSSGSHSGSSGKF